LATVYVTLKRYSIANTLSVVKSLVLPTHNCRER
jgi:hypothetical protein